MGVPVRLLGESLIDAVVEVLVVGEDNVAADIVKLRGGVLGAGVAMREDRETYEAFRCDISAGKTTGSLVAVDDHP